MYRRFSSLFALLCTLTPFSPTLAQGTDCKETITRKEWRTLTSDVKKAYITTVLKFHAQSDAKGTKGANYYARIHYEWGHKGIHFGAHFFPWHRYCTWLYEKELRKFNSKVRQHYWDASLDFADFWAAPVFEDSDISFGTIGTGPDNCVRNGPFKNIKPYIDKCLSRYSDSDRPVVIDSPSAVHSVISNTQDFFEFSQNIESNFHGRVHVATGGVMYETFRSPNEPLFFLHHSNVDRIWYIWQLLEPSRRFEEMYGDGRFPELESIDSKLYGFQGVTVRDVMDPSALCYTYDDLVVKDQSESQRLVRRSSKATASYGAPPASNAPTADATFNEERCLGELVNMQYPITIPERWIKMNGGDVNKVRAYEAKERKLIDQLNNLEGFVSPSCPVNRREVLRKEILRKPSRKLTCYVKGKKINIPVGKNADETVDNLLGELSKNLRPTSKPSPEALAAIIGKPCFKNQSLYNPFQACQGRK